MPFDDRMCAFREELDRVAARELDDEDRIRVDKLRSLLPALESETSNTAVKGDLLPVVWSTAMQVVAGLAVPRLSELFNEAMKAAQDNATVKACYSDSVEDILFGGGRMRKKPR